MVSKPDLLPVICESGHVSQSLMQSAPMPSDETWIDHSTVDGMDFFNACLAIISNYNPRIPFNNQTTLQRIKEAILLLPLDNIHDYF